MIGYVQGRFSTETHTGPWAIVAGVALDLLSDGVMSGTAVVDPALGLLLAAGQVLADLPEGFAAAATLWNAGVPRVQRLLLAASFACPSCSGRRSATSCCATLPSCSRCRSWR